MTSMDRRIFADELKERLGGRVPPRYVDAMLIELAHQMEMHEIEEDAERMFANDFDDILQMFLEAKRVEGRSENTVTRYEYIINRFRKFNDTPIHLLTTQDVRRFLIFERDRGLSERTLEGYRCIFLAFFGWIHREGLVSRNICANLNPIKYRKEVRLPFSSTDIERLKEACWNQRDKAIVSFLLSTGCRIGELCGLNWRDVDFRNLECTVLGKGNKERVVYIDEVTAMQLQLYLNKRHDRSPALFVGKGTNRMHPGGVRKRLNEIGERAGVENVHPHRFRRTLATNLISHGMPIQEVASVLGHDNVETTMEYVYLDKQAVKNSYRKYL